MCRRRYGEREFVARQRPCDVTGCLDLSDTASQSSQTTGASGGQLTSRVGCPHIRFGWLTDSVQMTWASDVTGLFAERAAMQAACALSLQSLKYVTCALFYAKAFSTTHFDTIPYGQPPMPPPSPSIDTCLLQSLGVHHQVPVVMLYLEILALCIFCSCSIFIGSHCH